MLQMPYAISRETGEFVSPQEVGRGLAANCVCAGCGKPVLSRQGDVKQWHFAHVGNVL